MLSHTYCPSENMERSNKNAATMVCAKNTKVWNKTKDVQNTLSCGTEFS